MKRPTVSVTGGGAGVNSAWEQRKLEARKMLENGVESPASSAPWNDGGRSFSTRETVQQKYTLNEQVHKPYKAVETHNFVVVPRCTLVAGPIDLTTGGEGAKTPMRKLTLEVTGTCSYR